MPLIGNVFKPLVKSVSIPLRLTAAASVKDAANFWIWYASFRLSKRTTLKISNEEMNDIMKKIQSLEESGLLMKGVRKAIKNEAIV